MFCSRSLNQVVGSLSKSRNFGPNSRSNFSRFRRICLRVKACSSWNSKNFDMCLVDQKCFLRSRNALQAVISPITAESGLREVQSLSLKYISKIPVHLFQKTILPHHPYISCSIHSFSSSFFLSFFDFFDPKEKGLLANWRRGPLVRLTKGQSTSSTKSKAREEEKTKRVRGRGRLYLPCKLCCSLFLLLLVWLWRCVDAQTNRRFLKLWKVKR